MIFSEQIIEQARDGVNTSEFSPQFLQDSPPYLKRNYEIGGKDEGIGELRVKKHLEEYLAF